MAFVAASVGGRDLDPVVDILARRMAAMRRCIAKSPDLKDVIRRLLVHYQDVAYPGTGIDNLSDLLPAPPPGWKGRAAWSPPGRPAGPVALLIGSLHRSAAALRWQEDEPTVFLHGEPPFGLLSEPCQIVKAWARQLAVRARLRHAAGARGDLGVGALH